MSFDGRTAQRRLSPDFQKGSLGHDFSSNTHSETASEASIRGEPYGFKRESIDLAPTESLDFGPVNDLFTPPSRMRKMAYTNNDDDISSDVDSDWDAEISPIMKTRESDGVTGVLFMSSDDPTRPESAPLQFSRDEGIVDYSSHRLDRISTTETKEVETKEPVDNVSRRSEEIASLRREVNKTSNDFNERIADAARRRKVAMTRSRDSLVAKEQEQLRSKTGFHEKLLQREEMKTTSTNEDSFTKKAAEDAVKTFKARPVPAVIGEKGTGGLNGVPKVEKRPTTTPFSPKLGARRAHKPKVAALQAPRPISRERRRSVSREKKTPQKSSTRLVSTANKAHTEKQSTSMLSELDMPTAFRARPLPSSLGVKGHGGQAGVPKVAKRPLTIARSPCLGPRRRAKSAEREKIEAGRSTPEVSISKLPSMRSIPRSTSTSSLRSADSPMLVGLKLLVDTPDLKRGKIGNDENAVPQNSQNSRKQKFELHSTRRAKERAQYNAVRDGNLLCKELQAKSDREKEIRKMQKEINVLRVKL